MKVIIAGSRNIKNELEVYKAVYRSDFIITEVVSGMAIGVDMIGLDIAKELEVPVIKFPANWEKYGKQAGYVRNVDMARYADALIAIWDGKSKGTKMMIDIAKKKGLKVYVYKTNQIKKL